MHDKPYMSLSHRPTGVGWQLALQVARVSMIHGKIDVVGDAMFFHAVSVQPDWVPHVEFVKAIGGHRFYRGDGRIRQTPAAVPVGIPAGRMTVAFEDTLYID